ncbi:MAG: response regulator [Terriglobia bacterium]
MKTVRILVADDHEVVRHGLRRLLEAQPGWEICGEAATGREAVDKAKRLKPDIVVLDYSMPALNGTEAARQIIKEVPRTEVLILTMHGSEQLIRGALEAGARGYALKSDASRDLISAVHALIEHKPFLSSSASGAVLDRYLKTPGEPTSQPTLTPREREIVQLVAEGRSNKEIAVSLEISTKTVEAHRANMMHKLGLSSVSDLVRFAIRNEIIEA